MSSNHDNVFSPEFITDVLEFFPGSVVVKDSSLRIVYANDQFLQFIGCTLDDIIGKNDYDLMGIEYLSDSETDQDIIQSGEALRTEKRLEIKNQTLYAQILKYRISFENAHYLVVLAQNIEHEYTKKNELQKNEIYLRTIVDYSDSVMAVLDRKGRIKNFLGSDRIINNPSTAFRILISEIIDTHSSKHIIDNINHVIKTKEELSLRKSLSYKNQKFYLKDYYYPIVNNDGSVTEVGIIRQDITENREIQEAYSNLVNNSSFGLMVMQDDLIVFNNSRFLKMIGFQNDEIEKKNIEQLIRILFPIMEREEAIEYFRRMTKQTSINQSAVFRLYTKNGSIIWVECVLNTIVYQGRKAIQAALIDITEKRHAISSLEKYKHIVNSSHEGIIFIDEQKKIRQANKHILEKIELPFEKIVNQTIDLIVGEQIAENLLPLMYSECFDSGKFSRSEQWISFPSGEAYIEISLNPYYEDQDKITGAIFVFNDITEEIETDLRMSEIAQNERRKIAMELHDGLTHELLGISINAKVLEKKIEETYKKNKVSEIINTIKSNLNSAIGTARNLSRGISPIHEQYTSLAIMLGDLKSIVESRYNITCSLSVADNFETLDDNILENLYYVVEEAITNAVKHAHSKRVEVKFIREEGYAVITVKNDGRGFVYDTHTAGMGIKFMKMRCRSISASLDILSDPSMGTTVKCRFRL